jgi:hypothetical protein
MMIKIQRDCTNQLRTVSSVHAGSPHCRLHDAPATRNNIRIKTARSDKSIRPSIVFARTTCHVGHQYRHKPHLTIDKLQFTSLIFQARTKTWRSASPRRRPAGDRADLVLKDTRRTAGRGPVVRMDSAPRTNGRWSVARCCGATTSPLVVQS